MKNFHTCAHPQITTLHQIFARYNYLCDDSFKEKILDHLGTYKVSALRFCPNELKLHRVVVLPSPKPCDNLSPSNYLSFEHYFFPKFTAANFAEKLSSPQISP